MYDNGLFGAFIHSQMEVSNNLSNSHFNLQRGESHAQAYSWSITKRKEFAFITKHFQIDAFKTIRIEGIWIGKEVTIILNGMNWNVNSSALFNSNGLFFMIFQYNWLRAYFCNCESRRTNP